MLNKLVFLIITLNLFFCYKNEKNNSELPIENTNESSVCYELSADRKKILRLSNFFDVKFDDVEKNGGVYVYFEIIRDELNLGYWSNTETIKEKIEKINENIFSIPRKNIFIGLKNFRDSTEEVIWFSNSRKDLFLEENAFGTKVRNKKTCIDRDKLNQIYFDRKREVEYGPVPTGDY
jgi:hypothetical protein